MAKCLGALPPSKTKILSLIRAAFVLFPPVSSRVFSINLARVTSHIPIKGQVTIRHFGRMPIFRLFQAVLEMLFVKIYVSQW